MKKFVALILIVIMCSSFVACGNDSSPGTSNKDSQLYTDNLHTQNVPDGYIGIYTAEDFQNIYKNSNANYILMNDIDLSGYFVEPVECYNGIFDGNNYTVYNYYSKTCLFDSLGSGSISNLHFKNAIIEAENSVGGLVNYASSNSITNCSYEGNIKLTCPEQSQYSAGGIVCYIEGNAVVRDCSFNGTIEVIDSYLNRVGGIIGGISGENSIIEKCYSEGNITLTKSENTTEYAYVEYMNVGGICGFSDAKIFDCYSTINIKNSDKGYNQNLGGIVGSLRGSCEKTYYNGTIDSNADENSIGGIAGTYKSNSEANQLQYCYYSLNIANAVGDGTPFANVYPLSEEDMQNQESYYGFDFETTWKMGNDNYQYPVLTK